IWSWGLAENGLDERSLQVIERGMARSDSGRIWFTPSFYLRRVQVLTSLGRLGEARRALEELNRRVDLEAEAQLPILRDVAEARPGAATGDTRGARALLRGALRAAQKLALWGDSSTGSQLTLARLDDLRLAAHEILVANPRGGRRFEMEWRAMLSQVGRNSG